LKQIILLQDGHHQLGKESSLVTPRNQLSGQVLHYVLPVVCNKSDQSGEERLKVTFNCPYILDETELASQVLQG
jgi:hypothetical protein